MSLETLMAQLQANTAKIQERRMESQQQFLDYQAKAQYSNPAAAPRSRAPQGRGKGNGGKVKAGRKGIISPIKGQTITSNYGPRTHPITGRHSDHTGVDFGAALGTPIRAAQSGIVRQANANDSIYGNQVVLGHGKKFQTMYGHMQKFTVKPGQRVKKGQIIGYVGSTGLSTGPHLHWETWVKGSPVNPMKFI